MYNSKIHILVKTMIIISIFQFCFKFNFHIILPGFQTDCKVFSFYTHYGLAFTPIPGCLRSGLSWFNWWVFLLRIFSVAIPVCPHVCFILVLILDSMLLRECTYELGIFHANRKTKCLRGIKPELRARVGRPQFS